MWPFSTPQTPSLGSGMAQKALEVLQSRPYQLHVQESKALGKKPLTPEEFLMMMQQQQMPQMPPPPGGLFGGGGQ